MPLRLMLLALATMLAVAPAAGARSLVDRGGVAGAKRWAAGREGRVAFALVDEHGRVRGYRAAEAFPSASLSKAMLLVAALRAAGMRQFVEVGWWSDEEVTAADQARFFARIDRLVPREHREYARGLLASVVSYQRWGIPAAVTWRRTHVFFKGGWRKDVVHQGALIERGHHRVALAVLTEDAPSQAYARATIAGIAARVLHEPLPPFARSRFRLAGAGVPRG